MNWQVGEIAFLKQRELLGARELSATDQVPPPAFGHPMIVLRAAKETAFALVTSVTAFGSGPDNQFLPPWDHPFHSLKPRHCFRAFQGTALPPSGRRKVTDWLQLRDGMKMPKIRTSWVYTRWSYVVPISALVNFDKSETRLRLTEASLKALLADMRTLSNQFVHNWADKRLSPSSAPAPPAAKAPPTVLAAHTRVAAPRAAAAPKPSAAPQVAAAPDTPTTPQGPATTQSPVATQAPSSPQARSWANVAARRSA